MNTEMVTPSQLHRNLQRAKDGGDERRDILASTLQSQNLAVIRRIPELLSPLSNDEKEMVTRWAEGLTQKEDVSGRDFAFHLMAKCGVPGERIIGILERNKTFSRSALEHIQKVLGGSEVIPQLDDYLFEVAEKLLTEERIPSRDRGRHMLMTLARSEDHWEQLAFRFSGREVSDLRQRVIERFLEECPDGAALTVFVENVVKMCLDCIRAAAKEDVHKEAPHMHWVITCLERQGKDEIQKAANVFSEKFGTRALPRSVKYRIKSVLCPEPPPSITTWYDWERPMREMLDKEAQLFSAPAMAYAPVIPYSIEEALRTGWTIRKESGRQVVLVKDGKSVTLYRPRVK